MCIRRTLHVHERLNANLHERNTTCVDKVSLKKIMSKQMRISLSRTGPRRRSKRNPISFLSSAPPLAAGALGGWPEIVWETSDQKWQKWFGRPLNS